ncbi:MAG: hypothetical protein M0C28_24450 [Candidatus Moduliflexus flocculans]|nr:hypothetical protein [Candidatus Moduliflexus flocculans]
MAAALQIVDRDRLGPEEGAEARAACWTGRTSIVTMIVYGMPAWWLGDDANNALRLHHQDFPFGRHPARLPPPTGIMYFLDVLWHMVLPVLTLVLLGFWGLAFVTRNIVLRHPAGGLHHGGPGAGACPRTRSSSGTRCAPPLRRSSRWPCCRCSVRRSAAIIFEGIFSLARARQPLLDRRAAERHAGADGESSRSRPGIYHGRPRAARTSSTASSIPASRWGARHEARGRSYAPGRNSGAISGRDRSGLVGARAYSRRSDPASSSSRCSCPTPRACQRRWRDIDLLGGQPAERSSRVDELVPPRTKSAMHARMLPPEARGRSDEDAAMDALRLRVSTSRTTSPPLDVILHGSRATGDVPMHSSVTRPDGEPSSSSASTSTQG